MEKKEKYYFIKLFADFIQGAQKLSKSEILTFLWLAMHADSRGNMLILSPELHARLLLYVGVKRETMYNIFGTLQKRQYITKHGDIILVNSQLANKHRKMIKEPTLYNWSLTELDF